MSVAHEGHAMNWSEQPPTRDGYYWLARTGKETTVVKVWDSEAGIVDNGARVTFVGDYLDRDLLEVTSEWHCRWAGPLKPPNV